MTPYDRFKAGMWLCLVGLIGLLMEASHNHAKASTTGCVARVEKVCKIFICPNGIRLTGRSAENPAVRRRYCGMKLGGRGATKPADGCIRIQIAGVRSGSMYISVYNPATFRGGCGTTQCHDCAPKHKKWGTPDLVAKVVVKNGWTKVPAGWFHRRSKAWLCTREGNLSVAFHPRHIRYLLRHRRTPRGDPARLARSRF